MDPLCEKGEHRPRNEMKDCGGPVVYCPGCQATLVWADGKWHPAGKGMELLKNNEAKAIAAEKLRKAQQPRQARNRHHAPNR